MSYTVNTLASLSGVTIRTLRFYDEIRLLAPAFVAENGYRYYEEQQLLRLQQILFFKELGFELKQIQEMLDNKDFDQIKALESHKKTLRANIKRMQTLVKTVDETVQQLQSKAKLNEAALFKGFLEEKMTEVMQKHYGDEGARQYEATKKALSGWTWNKEWANQLESAQKTIARFEEFYTKAVRADSPEAQTLAGQHFAVNKPFSPGVSKKDFVESLKNNLSPEGKQKQTKVGMDIAIAYFEATTPNATVEEKAAYIEEIQKSQAFTPKVFSSPEVEAYFLEIMTIFGENN